MEREYIDLGEKAFILINGPLIFLNLTSNIFYACCLIFPRNTQRLKQPLKMLLGFLVWCSVIYCVSLASLYWVLLKQERSEMFIVAWAIVLYYVHNSMTCSVWLNFYYYVQIVPAQRALFIWVKRNIKSVMYMTLLFDGTLILFCNVISNANTIIQISGISYGEYINVTWTGHQIDGLYFSSTVCVFIIKLHVLLCLCIMTVCSFSTAHYLHRHIRSVAQGGGCSSTPRIQSQLRVTITGISQGVLYFLYAAFYLFSSLSDILSLPFVLGFWSSFTVTSLYILGTTINLGIGQAVFRQRAANVCKALKALCGVGMVTNDVKLQSTSDDMANSVTADVQMTM